MAEQLFDAERCDKLSMIFKTLSHPHRLHIFCCLSKRKCTVGELQEACEASQSVISQHLTRMRLEGIVQSARRGKNVVYSLAGSGLKELIPMMEKIADG